MTSERTAESREQSDFMHLSNMPQFIGLLCLLPTLLLANEVSHPRRFNINDFGARPGRDSTLAIRKALAAAGGGEVYVPPSHLGGGVYWISPLNISSNVVLRIDGVLRSIPDASVYPQVDILPSYGKDIDTRRCCSRYHPLIWSINSTNVTICGTGTIDGSGPYWWDQWRNKSLNGVGRPHLIELYNTTDVTIAGPGLTLLNSAFWTLHPIYSRNVHIHDISISVPACKTWSEECGINTDGIDVDSCQDVIIENNRIDCGDDHVTILSGWGEVGRKFGMPSRNVTVRNNILGTGMGLSIGSSVSGGIEDVRYVGNVMKETREQWGQGVHLKTRIGNGGYVRNVIWEDNTFFSTGTEAILIEADYQSNGSCDDTNCTLIENIVLRNLIFHNSSRPGTIKCSSQRPCRNITFDNVQVGTFYHNEWSCQGVSSGHFSNISPTGLGGACGLKVQVVDALAEIK